MIQNYNDNGIAREKLHEKKWRAQIFYVSQWCPRGDPMNWYDFKNVKPWIFFFFDLSQMSLGFHVLSNDQYLSWFVCKLPDWLGKFLSTNLKILHWIFSSPWYKLVCRFVFLSMNERLAWHSNASFKKTSTSKSFFPKQ